MFLLVLAYPGCPGSKAVKRSLYTIFFLKYAIDFMIFCDKRIVCYLEIAAALIISYLLFVFSEFLYVEEDTT